MMAVLRVEDLPQHALAAAEAFYEHWLPRARSAAGDLVVVFGKAPYDHRGWRLAAIRDLARDAAPRRVNAVAGTDTAAIEQAIAYLDGAPGVTGQLLEVA